MATKDTERIDEIKGNLYKLSKKLLTEGMDKRNRAIIDVSNLIGVAASSIDKEERMEELNLLMSMFSAKAILQDTMKENRFSSPFNTNEPTDEDDGDIG